MKTTSLWPYSTRAAILCVPATLLILILIISATRGLSGWPTPQNERFVLIGVLVLSFAPLLLVVVDALLEQGATLEYKGLKLNLAQVQAPRMLTAPVPANIGVRGTPVSDSASAQILESLRAASTNEVIVVDLEDGYAWWETRLLVLLAGATRLGEPRAVVFVATEGGRPWQFQGWGFPRDLFKATLRANPGYQRTYAAVNAAVAQWSLVEPIAPGTAAAASPNMSNLAKKHPMMAFDYGSGLPNEFFNEQLLASELGECMEKSPRSITVVRLKDLFTAVLKNAVIDTQASPESQLRTFAAEQDEYIAITNAGEYLHLARRATVLTAMLESTMAPPDAKSKPT